MFTLHYNPVVTVWLLFVLGQHENEDQDYGLHLHTHAVAVTRS